MNDKIKEEVSPIRALLIQFMEFVNKVWNIRFMRFLFVGGINTIFGYIVFSILILFQIHYAIASFFSTVLGIIFNFNTTGRIVFKNSNPRLLFRFFGAYGISYIAGVLFLRIFDFYHVNMLIAGAILILPGAILSYTLNKFFVFRSKKIE